MRLRLLSLYARFASAAAALSSTESLIDDAHSRTYRGLELIRNSHLQGNLARKKQRPPRTVEVEREALFSTESLIEDAHSRT